MNIPFPILMPRLVDPKWFNADSPCDEETELAKLEQEHQYNLTCVINKFTKRPPLGKTEQEPMEEEAESDEGNEEESGDSEESHDEDEVARSPYSPSHNNNEASDSVDDLQLSEE